MQNPSEARELSKLVELIANLGAASEVELQAKTLKSLDDLHRDIEHLEDRGLVKRREGFFRGGYGDALELTPKGYKSVRSSSQE